jgi:5-methylcytosine-specific restriction endonuclease McrA
MDEWERCAYFHLRTALDETEHGEVNRVLGALYDLIEHRRQLRSAFTNDQAVDQRRALSASLRVRLWQRDAGICGICAEPADPEDFHIDHIKPYSRGGQTVESNLQVAHPGCNIAKHDRWHTDETEPPICLDDPVSQP